MGNARILKSLTRSFDNRTEIALQKGPEQVSANPEIFELRRKLASSANFFRKHGKNNAIQKRMPVPHTFSLKKDFIIHFPMYDAFRINSKFLPLFRIVAPPGNATLSQT
jgi:hypothetical protein